jgi:sulfite exporter TauE/SafE
MLSFGIGMSVPLLGIAYGLRAWIARNRDRFLSFNKNASPTLGVILCLTGLAILAGLDKAFEAGLVKITPAPLLEFLTSI